MNKLFLVTALVVGFSLVAGCAAENDLAVPTLTETIPPTNTLTPTVTATLQAPIVTDTVTPLSFPYLKQDCVLLSKIESYESSDVYIISSLIEDSIILSMFDGTRKENITNSELISVFSPERTKFAYIRESPRTLITAKADGSILQTFPIPANWFSLINWDSENKILIEKIHWDDTDRLGLAPSSLIILDLETGEFEELLPEYPDIYPFVQSFPNWHGNMTFLPDPTLNYVVYVAGVDNDLPIILWDLDDQSEILRIHMKSGSQSSPVWNHNGDWFITSAPIRFSKSGTLYTNYESALAYVPDGYDLFIVNIDGTIKRLTYYSTEYYARQAGFSLSPDETKLAFWVDTEYERNHEEWQLAILDIQFGEVTSYCVTPGKTPYPVTPIWSPLGDAIMVTNYDSYSSAPAEVSIIDITRNEVFTLPEYGYGEGWLVAGE